MAERTVLEYMMDHIVNPRCDECGATLDKPTTNGPELCPSCWRRVDAHFTQAVQEMRAADGPRRSVHIVKLPEGMRAALSEAGK